MTSKICIYGAGAIGGYLAACLHDAGADVSLIARGPHLQAIKKDGLKFKKNGESRTYHLKASDNPADFGAQDYVIIALKAHGITHITQMIQPLLGADTAVVSAVNGLPWWYFYKANTNTDLNDKPLYSVDPETKIWRAIGPERAIGCVVYPACEISNPGVVTHIEGDRISLGEPSGESTERLKILSGLMIKGGLKAPQKKRIRDEIWIKLWGNCSFNPVSALTGASLDKIAEDAETRKLVAEIMQECKQVGEALSIRFAVSIEDRINGAGKIIGHKPSTRQDIEMGRPLEIDPLVTALIEIAKQLDIETPALSSVSALLKLQARIMGLYGV
ncbi:2-dehydropantoate 2-reductase [Alphaproteobacteria bacterium]|jgi:2-dehydropantoate 2-reductase|nr:2-dehydropantoate 2-reductase [Alphaproteobacteria bacterium]MDC3311411.1 2-dehydropantoate 2-reductase [Alphaproteobacteria bacterium]